MCTAVTMPELIVVHHELGHVWYFMMYRDQPTTFQEGANPGRLETFCKNSYPLSTHPYHLTGKFGKFSLKYLGAIRAFFLGTRLLKLFRLVYENCFRYDTIKNNYFKKLCMNYGFYTKYIHVGIIYMLSLIHISEPTRPLYISYAVFCLKKSCPAFMPPC